MTVFNMFPKEHVWIPTTDGRFCQRPVTNLDKQRRGLVERMLARPILPRGMHLSPELEKELMEEKVHIRKALEELPAPYEDQESYNAKED